MLKVSAINGSVVLKRISVALAASTLLLTSSGTLRPVLANPQSSPLELSQRQGWETDFRVARLVSIERQATDLVLQATLLNKPETTYANAVYQVFARRDGRWEEIYTNTGARLISNQAGRLTLPAEVIPVRELEERLQDRFDSQSLRLEDVELRSLIQIRYDPVGGRRDQRWEFEQVQDYRAIATTTRTDLFAQRENQGQFSLAILQARPTLENVIARVSVKSLEGSTYQQEKFIGDYRYRLNQRARFVDGLKPGDRVVVRLFDASNRLIGYSEFDCLDDHAVVNLVLSDDPNNGILRTFYGIDADLDGRVDESMAAYDYFTQVTNVSQSSHREAQVVFLETTRSIRNLSAFNLAGLPAPRSRCTYPISLERGTYGLVDRRLWVFYRGLASAITSTPGQVVEIVSLDSSSTSVRTVNVSQSVAIHRTVGTSEGIIRNACDRRCIDSDDWDEDDRDDDDWDDDWDEDDDRDDDDWDDDEDDDGDRDDDDWDDDDWDDSRRRNCNQGIGNGAEGCDPGNSRPHGGSNDETGRQPEGRRR
ncbi:MAG: hypothetical protein ACFB8W_03565 [Elainellaceae cyanobacterium]